MAGPESCSFFFRGSVFLRCVLPGFLGSVLLNPCPACFFWGGQCFCVCICLDFFGVSASQVHLACFLGGFSYPEPAPAVKLLQFQTKTKSLGLRNPQFRAHNPSCSSSPHEWPCSCTFRELWGKRDPLSPDLTSLSSHPQHCLSSEKHKTGGCCE